jgi:ribosomal protein S21
MIQVEVRGGDIDHALKVLKSKLVRSGVTKELRDRRFFLSKGERRREKLRRSIRRIRKQERKTEQALIGWTG